MEGPSIVFRISNLKSGRYSGSSSVCSVRPTVWENSDENPRCLHIRMQNRDLNSSFVKRKLSPKHCHVHRN